MYKHIKRKVKCRLCSRSKETIVTGPLATKASLTAHQNCLLYSSGICCENSPEFDELFGFSVNDVMEELKRGSKLTCGRCKKRGATVGCEVKRCQRSFHYPCAMEDGALPEQDDDVGTFRVYCKNHRPKEISDAAAGEPSNCHSKSGIKQQASHKEVCCVCGQQEDIIRLETTHSGVKSYCKKHTPVLGKRCNEAAAAKLPSLCSKNSASSKRQMRSNDKNDDEPKDFASKRNKSFHIVDDSSSTELKQRVIASSSENGTETRATIEEETVVESDIDSESLLPIVVTLVTKTSPVSDCIPCPEQRTPTADVGEPASGSESLNITSSPRYTTSPIQSMQMGKNPCFPLSPEMSSDQPCTAGSCSPKEQGPDSKTFWTLCNEAGCTQALFSQFVSEINMISNRIQLELASQEDYDLSLRVMEASGKLAEMVATQERELQRKREQVQSAAAAMKQAWLALKR